MDKDRQRIKIAEACGFTQEEPWLDGRTCWGHKDHPKHVGFEEIPDFLYDLNAMHDAEKVLSRGQLHRYMLNMQEVKGLGGNNHWLNFHATAAQRAEAFLKTLDLWEQ